MGFLEILTLVLIILKALGIITVSWWVVFSPIIIALVIYATIFIFTFVFGFSILDKINKRY